MKSTELVDRIKAGETVKLGPYKLALQGSTENRAILGIEHENGTYEELNMNDGLITAKSMFGPGRHSITTDDELKQALQSSVGLEEEGKKTMKLTQEQLTEMVRSIVKDSFAYTETLADLEGDELDMIAAWAKGSIPELPPGLIGRLGDMHVDEMPVGPKTHAWLRQKMAQTFNKKNESIQRRAAGENKTMKLTQEKLTEMVRKVVKEGLGREPQTMAELPPESIAIIQAWMDGQMEDLPEELLWNLVAIHREDMPQGVQKGRDGMPDDWLRDHFDAVGILGDKMPPQGRQTVKLTQERLKEMVRKIVKVKLNEADDGMKDMPDGWVKYMKEVEDLFGETIKKMNDLADKGEEIMHDDRELDKVANPINSARSNHHEFVKERSEAVKELASTLARRLEAWKTRY